MMLKITGHRHSIPNSEGDIFKIIRKHEEHWYLETNRKGILARGYWVYPVNTVGTDCEYELIDNYIEVIGIL